MGHRRFFPMVGTFPINTIIGNMASEIPTKESLAARLNIPLKYIRDFYIDGSDVKASLRSQYSMPGNNFYNNTNITSFLDLDGYCRSFGTNSFSGSTCINIYAPNAAFASASIGGVSGSNLTNALYGGDYFFNGSTMGGIGNMRNTNIKRFVSPFLMGSIGPSGFRSAFLLESIGGKPSYIDANGLQQCVKLKTIDLTMVTEIGSFGLDGCSALTSVNLTNCIKLGNYALRGLTSCTQILLPELTTAEKTNTFRNLTSCTLIDMKKLKTFGSPSVDDLTFGALKIGCTINTNIYQKTSNAGGVDAAIQYAKTSRGAIINFYNDDGTYNSTL